jgi:hypothetical protein
MFYTILDDLILYQPFKLNFIKYSNYELKLHNYFYQKTQINPSYIIIIKIENIEYIFFFINHKRYFEARMHLNSIRNQINSKKILIIRFENILINLIFNLFPDLCIDDIEIEINNVKGKYEIVICFLRHLNIYHIAVGTKGYYIKTVNVLFERHINFFSCKTPLTIKCKAID